MPLTNKVAQFTADSDLVNEWVHGGPTASITTDSGPVRSPAKLIADLAGCASPVRKHGCGKSIFT